MVAATVIFGALWINGTRVALIALALVLVANVIWHFMHHNESLRYRARPVLIGVTVIAIGIAGIVLQRAYTARAIPVSESLGYRYEFNKTALLMFASRPLFGVGIDQFYLQSETFGSPDLPDVYRRVPAHNPFLQHAGELGITGVIAFTWLLGSALWLGFLALRKEPTDKLLFGNLHGTRGLSLNNSIFGTSITHRSYCLHVLDCVWPGRGVFIRNPTLQRSNRVRPEPFFCLASSHVRTTVGETHCCREHDCSCSFDTVEMVGHAQQY